MRSFMTAAVIFVSLFYVTCSQRQFTKCEEMCLSAMIANFMYRSDLYMCKPGITARRCYRYACDSIRGYPVVERYACPKLCYFVVSEIQKYSKFKGPLVDNNGWVDHYHEYCTTPAYEEFKAYGSTDLGHYLL
ncbi:hypothetical protein RB195_017492 [Necator americanus]|uniref:DB module n=1 Tax=Necator americanus TaxID=51031 RepID=A0ABR1C5H5_NECAM